MSYFSMLYLGFFFQTKQENRYELCGLTIGKLCSFIVLPVRTWQSTFIYGNNHILLINLQDTTTQACFLKADVENTPPPV